MVPTALLALFSLAAAQAKDHIQTHFTPPRELDAPVWTTPTGPFLQGTIRLSGERSGELGWVFNELECVHPSSRTPPTTSLFVVTHPPIPPPTVRVGFSRSERPTAANRRSE